MLDRLGVLGLLAALVVVGCVFAAVFQKSLVAVIVAIAAAIYVAARIFRSGDA